MPSYNIQDGNEGFKRFKTVGEGTHENPYVPVVGINVVPDVDSTTGWSNPLSDTNVVSEKLIKETIDNQEITSASFNTADGVLTLTKIDGNITVNLDGRYLSTVTTIDADVTPISNLEVDNFKGTAIVAEAEGISNNDNDTTIPTSAAVKDYVDNTVIPDTNTYVTSASFNTSDGVLTLTLNDTSTVTVDLDGRFLENIIEDTTPQLGGNLDLNSNDITGTGDINITGEITATTLIGNMRGATIFKAKAGEALTKGDPVYISGDDLVGNQPVVSIADSDDANKMPCFGLAAETVSLNANVNVVTFGTLSGLDTSSFNQGDILYISTTGTLTATKPSGESSLIQNIGKVMRSHASAGSIKVGGAGRTNDVPNLNDGNVFIGNASNQAETRGLTLDDLSETATNKHFTASDETKLDGIETGATADQTASEIKTAYESNADTNAFTDAEKTKLAGIETGADVTDSTNVDAAGAVMNSDTSTASMGFVIDEDTMVSDSATKVPTQQSVKAYVDANAGGIDPRDSFTQNSGQYIATEGIRARDIGGIAMMNDDGTAGVTVADNGDVDIITKMSASEIKARNLNGLKLHDDGGTGLLVKDGGDIEVDTKLISSEIKAKDANGLKLYEDGGNGILIQDGGNVGIGNTSPNEKLHINGNFKQDVSSQFPMVVQKNGTPANGVVAKFINDEGDHSWGVVAEFRVNGSTGADRPSILFSQGYSSTNWTVGFGSSTDDNFRINQNHGYLSSSWGTNRFFINTSGNVGIGTTSPSQKLDVNGNAKISGQLGIGKDPSQYAVLDMEMAVTSGSGAGINLKNTASGTSYAVLNLHGNNGAVSAQYYAGGGYAELRTYTNHGLRFGTNATERMRITNSGKVGIGETSPEATLHVKGDTSTSGTALFQSKKSGWVHSSYVHYGNNMDWYIRSGNSSGKVIIQDTGGNVGIGTSNPTQKLHVSGNAIVSGSLSKGSGSFDIAHPDPAKKDTHRLRHYFVETPSAGGNIYKYQVECNEGDNYIDLPDYFEHLNENSLVWANPFKHFGRAWGEVIENGKRAKIVVEQSGIYNILIFGDRKDAIAMQEFEKYGVEYEIKE